LAAQGFLQTVQDQLIIIDDQNFLFHRVTVGLGVWDVMNQQRISTSF
jgi:hypothetical protein